MNKTTVDQSEIEDQIIETSESLRDYLRACTRQALRSVIDEEVAQLCGPRHRPDDSAECRRSGSAPSYVMVNGGHEPMERPRVRLRTENGKGAEVQLKSWKLAQSQDEWEEAMMRAVLCGVSTRDVPSLRESEVARESRSSISRLWQRKSAELVKQQQESDLSEIDLVILMLDAVVLSGGMVATTALGIDADGRKHVLGFRIGSSENQQVCEDLLGALSRRGLKTRIGRHLLAVLDGSLALKNAVLAHYPHVRIQRCLVHKERNLRGYLSKQHWAELAGLFQRLRRSEGPDAAKEAVDDIERFLANKNTQARASFEEAGSELLTLLRLDVSNDLNISLLSTNCIENVFKNLRRHIGRVSRWRENTSQGDRWMASGLILAAQGFHRIKGYGKLKELIKALEIKIEAEEELKEVA
jgi:putative transposase